MLADIPGQFLASFILLLFVIIDPFSSLPVFLSVTRNASPAANSALPFSRLWG